jgi:hypothetical protein
VVTGNTRDNPCGDSAVEVDQIELGNERCQRLGDEGVERLVAASAAYPGTLFSSSSTAAKPMAPGTSVEFLCSSVSTMGLSAVFHVPTAGGTVTLNPVLTTVPRFP